MRKLLLLCTLLGIGTISAFAQSRVSGTVTDAATGDPLTGVTVIIKGTTIGSYTDDAGRYSIDLLPNASELTFTFLGKRSEDITIDGRTTIDVALEEDVLSLEDVVVVGYGTQRRVDVTGSISSVSAEEINELPVPGIDQALQGRVAGLILNSNSGQPGVGMTVRIRGNSSINAGNEPLYVIDGIPVTTGDFSSQAYGGQDFNALTDLNPNEIESIEVLKDAAATSIYGSRASNGVVLITTKRGKTGKPSITLNAYYGFTNPIEKYDMLSGEQFRELLNESRGTNDPWNGLDTDFMDLVFQDDAAIQEYDLSVSGGDEKTKYYIGGSFMDQEGTVIGQNFNRVSGRVNLDHRVNEKLSFGAGVNITRTKTNVVNSDNNIYGALSLAILQPSNVEAFNEDGSYNFTGMIFENPVAAALEVDQELLSYRTLANVFGRYEIIPGLAFQSKVALDKLNFDERNYIPATINRGRGSNGSGNLNTSDAIRVVNQNTLDFQRQINDLSLNVLAGIDYEQFKTRRTFLAGNGFPSAEFRWLGSAAEYTNASQTETENRLLSYYGRVTLNYDNKYIFTGTFRADGSSKFGENNRYGYFPSGSIAWRFSNENFLINSNVINDGKIRVSYGLTGNQAGIGNFASRGLAGGGNNYGSAPGVAPTQLPNPDLQWEQTTEINIGFDLALFSEVLGITFDWYQKTTEDLLLNRPLPGSSGFTSITQNVGEMENTGIEVLFNVVPFSGEFNWDFSLQFATNQNEVTRLFEGQGFDAGFANRIDEGKPLSYFLGWRAEEFVNPETGDVIYEDVNGDGNITPVDEVDIGNPNPEFFGGFRNNLSFKGFDLSFFFQFQYGNDILNYTRIFAEDGLRRGFNNTTAVLDRWQQPGDVTRIPRVSEGGGPNASRNNSISSRLVEDGSYIRLKNLSLGYTIPNDITSQVGISRLRFYVAGTNLWTLTDYSGLDPEVNFDGTSALTLGTDFLTQGQNKMITFGANLNF